MSKKVAIIGSGFGGLAAAIRLRAAGLDVTVFEKRDKPGGRAYVFHDDGFTFDAGPTVITAPHCLEELFETAGRPMRDYVTLVPVSPLYRLHWEDGYTFDYTNDLDDTLAQIARKAPGDVEGYRRFLAYTEEVFHEGYTKLAHVPFLHWSTMVRVSPQLLRLQAYRSVYSILSKYLKDEQLRQAFSFHSLLVGGNPFSTSSIYTLIHFLERKWGVYFAKGGTGALVAGLVRLFEDIGGKVRLGAEIEEISTREGKVSGVVHRDGTVEAFDLVVSNADVAATYRDLLRKEPRAEGRRRQLARAHFSMSLFLIYFGTRKRYPGVAHHNVIFGPRYRGLLDDIFRRGVLAKDFSLYLHAPTQTDPSLAPEGCENFYVLSPVPHLGKLDLDWKAEGPAYADRILEYLDRRYLPGLQKSLVTRRIFTPLDFKSELNAHLGSAFSLDPRLTQSAWFRTHNRDERIEGLYFAGAGTHPGAGVPGVVNSAKATAGLVLEDLNIPVTVTVPGTAPISKEAALEQCRQMIRVGSKSFAMASTFFGPATRDAAFYLYGWCRYCDDQVDRAESATAQRVRVDALRSATLDAFRDEPRGPVFVALAHVAKRYRLPEHYALELLEGMAMDARRERYGSMRDLLLYCYRVAGTVGLMMSHIMGVSREDALAHASDLGSAMQLTNIARDVLEDAAMGRVYLPLEWLAEAGVPPEEVAHPRHRAQVAAVTARLLDEAARYYRSGNAGLKYLPLRAAFAVATASAVYSAIGDLVRRRGAAAWDTRAYTSRRRKLGAVLRGLWLTARTVPHRLVSPWRPVRLERIWRFA